MNKRVLNPKSKYSEDFLNSLPIEAINDQKFRKLEIDERITLQSCQCFKDCDCRGAVVGKIVNYYRPIELDNTDTTFQSEPKIEPKKSNQYLK